MVSDQKEGTMKLEDLTQDKLDELVGSVEKLTSDNATIKADLMKFKAKAKGADIDPDAYAELQTTVETLKAELDKTSKTSKKTIDDLNAQLSGKDASLSKYLIDGQLTENLVKSGIGKDYIEAVKAMHRGNAKIVVENGEYVAMLGDKKLSDAINEWGSSDLAKPFKMAANNQGGGANGGSGSGGAKTMKRSDFEALPQHQRGSVISQGVTVID